MPVGVPGAPRRSRGGGNKAKAAEYRHSEKGMMARKARMMDPEYQAKSRARREASKRMKAGF